MTAPYAYPDTCLLIPLFVEEKGSAAAERIVIEFTRGGEMPLVISELTRLEFSSVIAKYIRIGILGKEQARLIIAEFSSQCERNFLVLPVLAMHFHMARKAIAKFATPLRSLDALHLAVAHDNNCVLVTADKQLAAASATLGVANHYAPCL